MRNHSDLPAFRPGLDEHPDNSFLREVFADFFDIECEGDPRGTVLRHACDIGRQISGVAFPDRFEPFWTQSEGWGTVGKQLEALAAHPQDTAAFRERCQRLLRGNVQLDPEDLEPTLRLQYDLQAGLLSSLHLLNEDDDGRFVTAIDGKRYPLPAFDEILSLMQTPEMQTKLRQGFDTLLLVPFGLPLDRLLDAWRHRLRRNAAALRRVGAFSEQEPLWVWEEYRTESLVYEPRSLTAGHRGRTKAQLLASDQRGWDVLLVEGTLQNLPRAGQGQLVGDRRQIECNRTPTQYLADLRTRGEVGLTPEAYILQFLDALERQGHVLDVETYTYLPGAFLPSSRRVPCAFWGPGRGRALLRGGDPESHDAPFGVRAAVGVG